jgi:hypothetical protein
VQKRLLVPLVAVPLLAAVAGTVAWVAWQTLRADRICRARATVVSITAGFAALAQAGPAGGTPALPDRTASAEAMLAPSETDRLLAQLARMYPLDFPKGWAGTGPMLDPWRKRFVLYWSTGAGQETSQLHAGSSGPDGLWGTPDDILPDRGDDARHAGPTRGR